VPGFSGLVGQRRYGLDAAAGSQLPDLAMSLNNLSVQLALIDAGDDDGADIWRETIDRLPNSAARAELRAAWAERLIAAQLNSTIGRMPNSYWPQPRWTRTGLWAASPNPRR
jgi:hypothetical protein